MRLQHIYSYILILSFSPGARKQSLGPLSIYRARPAPLPIRDSVDDPPLDIVGSPTEALEAPAFDAYATSVASVPASPWRIVGPGRPALFKWPYYSPFFI